MNQRDLDFPMTKISVQDFATAPTFITYQTDVSALNRCVQCINKNIATTQCIAEQGRSTASLDKVKGDSGADGVTSDSRITFFGRSTGHSRTKESQCTSTSYSQEAGYDIRKQREKDVRSVRELGIRLFVCL